jgi:hypothetical protein
VPPEFLADGSEVPAPVEISRSDPPRPSADTAEVPKPSDATSRGAVDTAELNEPSQTRSPASPIAADDGAWGRVIGPDLEDVVRSNHLGAEQRSRLDKHLFGAPLPSAPVPEMRQSSVEDESSSTTMGNHGGLATPTLAARVNHLLATNRKKNGEPYSSVELAAKISKSGCPVTVTAISQLRAGVGAAPSEQVARALAKFFGVTQAFLLEGVEANSSAVSVATPRQRSADSTGVPKSSDSTSQSPADTAEDKSTSSPYSQASPSGADDGARGRVIGPDLEDVVAVSKVLPSDCWLAPSQSGMRCRPPNDSRTPLDLPKLPLHRWAWMIANGLTTRQIPTYLIQIRRRCAEPRCCNPDHLIAAAPGGDELTPSEVAALLDKSYVSSAQSPPAVQSTPRPPVIERAGFGPAVRPPLTDDLTFISAYCPTDASGCWIAPTTSAVPCRAAGDHRPERDLPKLKVQRWAWMVAHGRASNPLPGNLFQIWKHCGNSRCANPDHLYLTDPDGEESSVEDAEEWLRSVGTGRQQAGEPSPVAPAGGRHRASSPDTEHQSVFEHASRAAGESRLFADRLNALFDGHRRSDGTPLTSGDVAASLQADGLALSENLIDRLRAGSAGAASQPTVDALTFYFTVDADYFTGGSHAVDLRTHEPTPTDPSPSDTPTTMGLTPAVEAVPAQNVSMSIDEIGSVLAGLAETISDCLARSPADTARSVRLAPLIVELATLLTVPSEQVYVGRPLLRRISEEWVRAGGGGGAHRGSHSILDRLSALISD